MKKIKVIAAFSFNSIQQQIDEWQQKVGDVDIISVSGTLAEHSYSLTYILYDDKSGINL